MTWGFDVDPTPLYTKVFISHSSIDTWVARQIKVHVAACGARTFLDESDIEYGEDFESRIIAEAADSTELLVLFTPWAKARPYIWIEIGLFLRERRIIGVLYGLTPKDISKDERMPALLKRIDLVPINDLDDYFEQLKKRVKGQEEANA